MGGGKKSGVGGLLSLEFLLFIEILNLAVSSSWHWHIASAASMSSKPWKTSV